MNQATQSMQWEQGTWIQEGKMDDRLTYYSLVLPLLEYLYRACSPHLEGTKAPGAYAEAGHADGDTQTASSDTLTAQLKVWHLFGTDSLPVQMGRTRLRYSRGRLSTLFSVVP